MPDEHHVYANNDVVSFLYDRPECRSTGGSGNHKCDVILMEVSASKCLWIIECKSVVSRSTASNAVNQIEGCLNVIHNARGWQIEKCVIAESFNQEAARLLESKRVLHFEFSGGRTDERTRNIVNAVKKIKGY
ncbi:MAG: hypothetical protein ACYCSO_09110 [Cuniculiplasma sp.]